MCSKLHCKKFLNWKAFRIRSAQAHLGTSIFFQISARKVLDECFGACPLCSYFRCQVVKKKNTFSWSKRTPPPPRPCAEESFWVVGCRFQGILTDFTDFISQRVLKVVLCRSQPPHNSVNLSLTITNIKKKLTDLCGNWLLQNDFMNTFGEIRATARLPRKILRGLFRALGAVCQSVRGGLVGAW